MNMFTIQHETPFDGALREALLDDVLGEARFTKTSARLREHRLPAEGLSFVAGALDGAHGLVCATGRFIPKPDLSALVAGLFARSAPGSHFHRNKAALSPRAA
jgi:predicted N-acetyltransferase YhbS